VRRRRKGAPPAPRAEEASAHPLGTYGLDWDDDFACIMGFTSGGAPYGVQWWEATHLLDDPELGDEVRRAIEAENWLLGPDLRPWVGEPPELDPDRDCPF
jgi:hypothetical protein